MDKKLFKDSIHKEMLYKYGKTVEEANAKEKYDILSTVIMRLLSERWKASKEESREKRNAYYFSAEFLVGRSLGNNLLNFGITEEVEDVLEEMGMNLNALEEEEEDAALGNGGLGRLAACFIDSAATLDLPLQGYGVRYSQGLFRQKIVDGFQVEEGDDWTRFGDPWSIRVDSEARIVTFKDDEVLAVPYDMPIIGYGNERINTLRLWQAEALDGFNFQDFNNFCYDVSLKEKNRAEDITRVLYPNDSQKPGKVLRLKQQYLFVSASIQDLVAKYKKNFPEDKNFKYFSEYHIIQLNDTHPVMAIPELMRLLLDQEHLEWDDAWDVVSKVFAFTNHTILEEAMEKWDIDIVDSASPRCLEIITEIDRRFTEFLNSKRLSEAEIEHLRIINHNQVRMANLAIYTSISINGVAELHTQILKEDTLHLWYELFPERFSNKTNGVTPRRWLMYSNPKLSEFITDLLGSEAWKSDLMELKKLEAFADDDDVLDRLNEIKHENKVKLAEYIRKEEGVEINPDHIFDIQIKRLHEYKRQLLNALQILDLYFRMKKNPNIEYTPKTFIFGAKAAPGYFRAKAIIKFINEVGRMINEDPEVNSRLQVVFVENYNVSYGERLFPAADVSEQISTAGKEASGTGNMKFMMNGAVTIGTLDGANVEIFREAGLENNYLFGAKTEELAEIFDSYNPMEYYMKDPDIKKAVDFLMDKKLDDDGTYMLLEIYKSLIDPHPGHKADRYFVLKDFESYKKAQQQIGKDYKDRRGWAKKCLINIANCGKFSSDRTIRDYAEGIWKI